MKKLFISGACFGLVLSVLAGTAAFAQTVQSTQSGSGDLSALVARQQLRMDTLEKRVNTLDTRLKAFEKRLNTFASL